MFLKHFKRASSRLAERIKSLKPEEIDPLTRRPIIPIDNVCYRDQLPQVLHSLDSIYDNIHHDMKMELLLDPTISLRRDILMCFKFNPSISKRLPSQHRLLLFPHPHKGHRKLLSVVPGELVEEAKSAGADLVGTAEEVLPLLISSKYEAGEDFDVMVSHMSQIKDLIPMRKKLDVLFPAKHRGTLGEDVASIIKQQKFGQYYEYDRNHSKLDIEIGHFEHTLDEFKDNAEVVFKHVVKDLGGSAKVVQKSIDSLSFSSGPNTHYLSNIEEFCDK